MSLQDEIADEYLPDVHVNGMDCPDTESAKDIINKVLDAVVEAQEKQIWHIKADKYIAIRAINKLRLES